MVNPIKLVPEAFPKLKDNHLLELYGIYVEEEIEFIKEHHKRVDFYSFIIIAVLGATVKGIIDLIPYSWYYQIILFMSPVFIYIISGLAIKGTDRVYKRFLQAVTMRAKIEQGLGLTQEYLTGYLNKIILNKKMIDRVDNPYWASDPLIYKRHIKSRKEYDDSDAFVKGVLNSKKSYRKDTKYLFFIYKLFSMILGFIIFISLIFKILEQYKLF
jgi:hypothetical protein